MLRIFLLLCIAVGAFGRYHHSRHAREVKSEAEIMAGLKKNIFNKVPDCKKVLGDDGAGFSVPGCPDEVKTCMKETRNKGKQCLVKEIQHWMKHEKAQECKNKHKGVAKDWIGQMCKTKMDVKRCLDGEEPPAVPDSYDDTHAHSDHLRQSMKKHFKHECWKDMHQSYKACKAKAMEKCDDKFKACSGRKKPEGDDKLLNWYKIARHNKHELAHKIKHAHHTFSDCLGIDHEASSDSHEHFW